MFYFYVLFSSYKAYQGYAGDRIRTFHNNSLALPQYVTIYTVQKNNMAVSIGSPHAHLATNAVSEFHMYTRASLDFVNCLIPGAISGSTEMGGHH